MSFLVPKKETVPQKEWFVQNRCLFFGIKNKYTEKDANDYVLNFDLNIIQGVRSGQKTKGGWVFKMKHLNDNERTYIGYLTSAAFQSKEKFHSEVQSTPDLPAIIAKGLTTDMLGSLISWKSQLYNEYCTKNNKLVDKKPVEHRNLMDDNKTLCFAPSLFFEKIDGKIAKIDPKSSEYVWVKSLAVLVPLEVYTGPEEGSVLEIIRRKLEADGMDDLFICYLLTCGHTAVLSLHYSTILEKFKHVPALIVTGNRNTGKTQSTELSLSFLGTNADSLCVAKELSLPAIRQRCAEEPFPLVVHDCSDSNTVATAIHESYEGKPIMKFSEDVKKKSQSPKTSIAFTCNEKQMEYLRTRREALGRAVVIPMTLQLPYMSEEDFEDFQRGKEFASRYFENLVCVSDAEVDRLWSRAFSLRRAVSQRLEDITDSQHRIAENYSMLIAATELFLDKTGHVEWKAKIEPFALQSLIPKAAEYYMVTDNEHLNRSVSVPSITKDESACTKDALKQELDNLCTAVKQLQGSSKIELEQCLKVFPKSGVVAVREDEFLPLLASLPNKALVNFGTIQHNVPRGAKASFKFTGPDRVEKNKRCLGLPIDWFDENQLNVLNGKSNAEPQQQVKEHTPELVQPVWSGAVRNVAPSPFKSIERTIARQKRGVDSEEIPEEQDDNADAPSAESPEHGLKNQPRSASVRAQSGRLKKPSAVGTKEIPVGSQTNLILPSIEISSQPALPLPAAPGELGTLQDGCVSCKRAKSINGETKTYQCSSCRRKFHFVCQNFHEAVWNPAKPKAKNRKCDECRASH